MSIVKFLSREKLVEYLDEELRVFLNDEGIYEINQYGWLADDSPDPDYLGLAMWQSEPPISHNEVSTILDKPDLPVFSQTDLERIFKTGLEFKSLMQSARHSIGLAHLYRKESDDPCSCCSHHFSDATMKLDMATASLRELFVDAFSGFPGFYNKGDDRYSAPCGSGEQNRIFCQPFQQARQKLAENPCSFGELLCCVEELTLLVEQIPSCRIKGGTINNWKLSADNHFAMAKDGSGERAGRGESGDFAQTKESVIGSVSEWYKLLVNTGNQIFMAEYLLRNFSTPPKAGSVSVNR